MAQSIYGGRVDNEFDQRLLNTFLERLFTTRSFDSEFKLACKVDGHKDIQMPDGIRCGRMWEQKSGLGEGCLGGKRVWSHSLPDSDSKCPAFSGERSLCSGWSCCLTPRHPHGWASPTMLKGSCLPPKVGSESPHSWTPAHPKPCWKGLFMGSPEKKV
jgi:hypothetical protein